MIGSGLSVSWTEAIKSQCAFSIPPFPSLEAKLSRWHIYRLQEDHLIHAGQM